MKAILLATALTLLLTACDHDTTPPPRASGTTVTAELVTVTPHAIHDNYTTTGTLVADERIDIASRMSGFIRNINVREGERIKKGELLLTIDPTEIEAQLAEARARLSQVQARRSEAQADLERFRTLYEQKLIAVDRFQKAQLAARLADEELRAAQATLKRIEVQLDYAQIRSPVNGVVVSKHREVGDIATPGAPILTIENPDNIVLRTFIKEDTIRHISLGDTVQLQIDAAHLETQGIISQIVTSGDPATFTYLVKITPRQTRGISSGMFARATFSMGSSEGLAIPNSAIVTRADLPGTYIVDERNVAHYRMLRTGRVLGTHTEVLAGLLPGDRVVVSSRVPVHSGDRIVSAAPADSGQR